MKDTLSSVDKFFPALGVSQHVRCKKFNYNLWSLFDGSLNLMVQRDELQMAHLWNQFWPSFGGLLEGRPHVCSL